MAVAWRLGFEKGSGLDSGLLAFYHSSIDNAS
jgi:hypothetical protein